MEKIINSLYPKAVICVTQQVFADIFNVPVYTKDVPNSAALGGCYRAKHGMTNTVDSRYLNLAYLE